MILDITKARRDGWGHIGKLEMTMPDQTAVTETAHVLCNIAVDSHGKMHDAVRGGTERKNDEILRRLKEGTVGLQWVESKLQDIIEGCKLPVHRHYMLVDKFFPRARFRSLTNVGLSETVFVDEIDVAHTVAMNLDPHSYLAGKDFNTNRMIEEWQKKMDGYTLLFPDIYCAIAYLQNSWAIPSYWRERQYIVFAGTIMDIAEQGNEIPGFPAISYNKEARFWEPWLVPCLGEGPHVFAAIKLTMSGLALRDTLTI